MELEVAENLKKSKKLKNKAVNKKFNLPKGNWTKQLKVVPSNFDEAAITKHHCDSLAKKHLTLGYRMFKASKVTEVFLSLDVGPKTFIKARVEASFTLSSKYDVAIKLDNVIRKIDIAWCACKAGCGGVCKHVGSVLWFILDCIRLGKTFVPDDLASQRRLELGVSHQKKKLSRRTFTELDFVKHTPGKSSEALRERQKNQQNYRVLDNIGTTEDEEVMRDRIKSVPERLKAGKRRQLFCLIQEENQFAPAQKLHDLDSNKPKDSVSVVTHIRISLPIAALEMEEEIQSILHRSILKTPDKLKITLDTAINLEVETREQSNCLLWKSERKCRITASKFGLICKRQKEVNEPFLNSIFNRADLSRNKYIQEGFKNEDLATDKYEKMRPGVKSFAVGLCINPSIPMLGASPDRLVLKENEGYGLLEIKTLAKCKEKSMNIEEAIAKKEPTSKFFKKDENGDVSLDLNHNFYYQIQGQLGLTGLKWCDLLVDCGDEHPFCQCITFDKTFFIKIVSKLLTFYVDHGISFLEKQM